MNFLWKGYFKVKNMINKTLFDKDDDYTFTLNKLSSFFLYPICLHLKSKNLLNKVVCLSSHEALTSFSREKLFVCLDGSIQYAWVENNESDRKKFERGLNCIKSIASALSCTPKEAKILWKIFFQEKPKDWSWYLSVSLYPDNSTFNVMTFLGLVLNAPLDPLNTNTLWIKTKKFIFSEDEFMNQPAIKDHMILIDESFIVEKPTTTPSLFQRLTF